MSPELRVINTSAWVDRVMADPVEHLRRQAVEVVLYSIACLLPQYRLYLKGGLPALGRG